ncbi:MAG: CPBP family intramembrane metalloprotease [Propionibacteriaceae bacterium]|jgi:membrane protease YdiL (CAAX protease family)|nr:CPBP family intramembrane metalloprotease [Propionibacteriaceae bacterium]
MASGGYRRKTGRAKAGGKAVEPAQRKPTFRERAIYSTRTLNPPSGVDYSRVLSGPGQRPVTSVAGLAAVLLGFFIIYPLVAKLVLTVGYLMRGMPGTSAEYTRDALAFHYWEGLLAAHIGWAVLIPVTFLLLRYVHRREGIWLSSVQPGMRWRYLLFAVVIAALVMNGVYWMTSGKDFGYNPESNLGVWLAVIFVTTPFQAAAEEYFFRGYLTQVLGSLIKWRWVSVAASALLFGAAHGFGQSLPMFTTRVVFGLVMGALVVLTGGLEAAIAAHVVNNLSAFTYAALGGGVAAARSFTEATWEAGAINIASYAVVGVICYFIGRALKVARYTPALD